MCLVRASDRVVIRAFPTRKVSYLQASAIKTALAENQETKISIYFKAYFKKPTSKPTLKPSTTPTAIPTAIKVEERKKEEEGDKHGNMI